MLHHLDINNDKRMLYEIQIEEIIKYEYGARFYDSVVGRWSAVDSLAEQYCRWSPYNDVMNKQPDQVIDPDRMGVYEGLGIVSYTGEIVQVKLLANNFFTDGTVYGTLKLEYRGGSGCYHKKYV